MTLPIINSPKRSHQYIWAIFVRQFVAKELVKIAQSGHTGHRRHLLSHRRSMIRATKNDQKN